MLYSIIAITTSAIVVTIGIMYALIIHFAFIRLVDIGCIWKDLLSKYVDNCYQSSE